MTELEKRIQAKIPGEDTGIEVRPSICAICSPDKHCGLDCYVKDGQIIKIEGTQDHPYNHGKLCTKGSSNRNYLYRKDRIQTPLKRVGERGEGKFEPISWDEAYKIIAENLNRIKETYSPHSVVFYSGHCKWYRFLLQRLAYSFGSVNYGTDDSNCAAATHLANAVTVGRSAGPDLAHTNVFLGWNYSGYYSDHMSVENVRKLKERGGKVIIIDTRYTPAAKNLADVFLHVNPGTDGALALGIANVIIENGWENKEYIEKYTYGFEEYKALAAKYPLDKVAKITGVTPEQIVEVARLYATNGPAATNYSACALTHRINGFQTHRAVFCLAGITGNYDQPGGNLPIPQSWCHKPAGFTTREVEFRMCRKPDAVRMGEGRFPIWDKYEHYQEYQAMTLQDSILHHEPYPIKAVFGMGMNLKMFPQTDAMVEAIKKLDFFVDVDLFSGFTTRYADIVLPACTTMERSELKAYGGGYFQYTKPVIPPLYESKSDANILCELAKVLGVDDPLLTAGHEACLDWIIEGTGVTIAELKKAEGRPVKVASKPYIPGSFIENGTTTPTGKFEFYSTSIASIDPKYGLNPLPEYEDALFDQNDEETRTKYPFMLITGIRVPHTIHSRLHEVPWLRSLRPKPFIDVNKKDAAAMNIHDGDMMEVTSPYGRIRVMAHLTAKMKPGVLHMTHGYSEANVNCLIGKDHLDRYSGFPGLKAMRTNIRKCEEAEE